MLTSVYHLHVIKIVLTLLAALNAFAIMDMYWTAMDNPVMVSIQLIIFYIQEI